MQLASFPRPVETDDICPIHHVRKVVSPWKKGPKEPLCPVCQQEQNQKELRQAGLKMLDNQKRGFLTDKEHKELVRDKNVFRNSFDNFRQDTSKEREVFQQVRHIAGEYLKYPDKQFNTLLTGTPGGGKTHLAWGMLKVINDNAQPAQRCLFINFSNALTIIKSGFGKLEPKWTQETVTDLALKADLLVLDDLGTESSMGRSTGPTQWVSDMLYDILEGQKRVIVTSNLSLDEIQRTYDPKLVSRLLRGSRGHIVSFDGVEDKRLSM